MNRYAYVVNRLHETFNKYKSNKIIVGTESYAFGVRMSMVLSMLSEIGGILRYHIFTNFTNQILEFTPKELKSFLVGDGNASKNDMIKCATKITNNKKLNEHEADATSACLAVMGICKIKESRRIFNSDQFLQIEFFRNNLIQYAVCLWA